MTRKQFADRAVREAERRLGVPPGWWGTRSDVRGPDGRRVFFSAGAWVVAKSSASWPDKWIRYSRHDSRSYAIAKARKL